MKEVKNEEDIEKLLKEKRTMDKINKITLNLFWCTCKLGVLGIILYAIYYLYTMSILAGIIGTLIPIVGLAIMAYMTKFYDTIIELENLRKEYPDFNWENYGYNDDDNEEK